MFNLGFTEILILAVIGLLVLGPEQLPVVARKLARTLNDLKRVTDEALQPVNEMKSQAQDYLHKTREEMAEHEQSLQKTLNDESTKAVHPEAGEGGELDPAPSVTLAATDKDVHGKK